MSDKLDFSIKDFSQLVSGAAILLSFFAGYRFALRNVSSTQTSKKDEKEPEQKSPSEGVRVRFRFRFLSFVVCYLPVTENHFRSQF